jgi:YVTN family beta-propeller protein
VYVAVQATNTVAVIDPTTNMIVATIPVGAFPIAFGVFIAQGAAASYVPPTTSIATTGCGTVSPSTLQPYFDLFSPGTQVTARPCPGHAFLGWTGGPCDKTATNPCNIPGGTTGVKANFTP